MQERENRPNKWKAKIKQQMEPKSKRIIRNVILTRQAQMGIRISHQF